LVVLSPAQHAILASVGRELTSAIPFADGFSRAMRLLDQRLGAKRSILCVSDERLQTLTIEAVYGAGTGDFRARYGLGVAGRVAEGGRPIVVPRVAKASDASGPK
jgi:hypothetical protein